MPMVSLNPNLSNSPLPPGHVWVPVWLVGGWRVDVLAFSPMTHQLLLARRGVSNLTKQDARHPAHRGGGRAVSKGGAAPAGQSPAEGSEHD